MSGRFLLDTNIILGFLKGQESIVKFIEMHEDFDLYTSVITRLELLSFHGLMK